MSFPLGHLRALSREEFPVLHSRLSIVPCFICSINSIKRRRERCWERLRAGGEGVDRGWDGWMASPTRWTKVWASSGRWWWTGRPGVLQSLGLQRVGHDWVTELTELTDCLLSWAISKTSSDNHFTFFFFGMVLFTASFWNCIHSSSGTLSTRSNPLNLFVTSTVLYNHKGFDFGQTWMA